MSKQNPQFEREVQKNLIEILNLYGDLSITTCLNDLVAIGTWPTPEQPDPNNILSVVAIDTNPLLEDDHNIRQSF